MKKPFSRIRPFAGSYCRNHRLTRAGQRPPGGPARRRSAIADAFTAAGDRGREPRLPSPVDMAFWTARLSAPPSAASLFRREPGAVRNEQPTVPLLLEHVRFHDSGFRDGVA